MQRERNEIAPLSCRPQTGMSTDPRTYGLVGGGKMASLGQLCALSQSHGKRRAPRLRNYQRAS